ncbi:hypothetical protein DVR12_17330 [Chitinophaga silvatica]|uniref:Uncharacterized protein n=1 Tax=Chitinophaga silvatica TaxID=2282649 RepID=A0A3E1Y7P3_9BACT|nr:hypothetical protein [Chitinophaga silvatica]RFS21100.1 hypothetical protein DVR12_17330 [Chitinophaga silvatica]
MKKLFLSLFLSLSLFVVKAQIVGNIDTIKLIKTYDNRITTALAMSNYRSGFVFQTNGSMNMGLVGARASGFRFRWLAREGPIDYTATVDSIQVMALDYDGNLHVKKSITIGIGQDTGRMGSNKYALMVGGAMSARQVKVTQKAPWPDYVFHSSYVLPPLQELEQFIIENKHLPEIPSEKEVKAEGQDLGEMNRLLLKKVEELTLYIIQLNKRVDEQEKIINARK